MGLGAIMMAAFLVCARVTGPVGGPLYVGCLGVAAGAYLLAIRELTRTPKFARRVVLVCLAMAAAWRVPFLLVPPGPADDVLRYVWDGRLQHLGYNPYTAIPSDPALSKLHTAETRQMNNPDLPSPYPPGAQLFFRAVTAIHESAFAFKVTFAACDLMIVLLLLAEFPRSGVGEHWVLAYAWNPLLVTSVAYSGHIDILGALLLLMSAISLRRRWRAFAAVTFGLAVAVKLLPAVLVPLYWRRVRVRDGLLTALVVGSLYTPLVSHGTVPLGSLGVFVQRFRFNDPVFTAVERVVPPQAATGVAVLCGLLTAAWMRRRQPAPLLDAWAWPMAVSLAAAPVVYPWYLLWLVPFLRPASTVPLTVWTLSILSVFYVWYSYAFGGPWQVPDRILWLEYGSVAIVAAIMFVRRQSRPTASNCFNNRGVWLRGGADRLGVGQSSQTGHMRQRTKDL
jgi:alpha-1,6-mannosyltransferase